MTAAHPGASRSPDRTGVCCAGRNAPSQCEMVTRPGFSSPNQPDQERSTAYRDSSGPDSFSDAHCAITVGDWEEPSGESRLIQVNLVIVFLIFRVHRTGSAQGQERPLRIRPDIRYVSPLGPPTANKRTPKRSVLTSLLCCGRPPDNPGNNTCIDVDQ